MKTRWMAVMAFVLMFAAGVGVGLLIPWPKPGDDRSGGPNRDPMGYLNLTAEQREQLKTIWSEETGEAMRDSDATRREASKVRRDAIQAMLTEEQQATYAEIQKQFEEAMQASHEARRAAFDRAHDRTREMLTDEQREQFDTWLEERREQFERGRERGADGEDRGRWRGWRDGNRSERGDRGPKPEGGPHSSDDEPRPDSESQATETGLTS